jgi:hypothetical protein
MNGILGVWSEESCPASGIGRRLHLGNLDLIENERSKFEATDGFTTSHSLAGALLLLGSSRSGCLHDRHGRDIRAPRHCIASWWRRRRSMLRCRRRKCRVLARSWRPRSTGRQRRRGRLRQRCLLLLLLLQRRARKRQRWWRAARRWMRRCCSCR